MAQVLGQGALMLSPPSRRAAGGGARPGRVGITTDSPTDRPTAPLPAGRRARGTPREHEAPPRTCRNHRATSEHHRAVTIAQVASLVELGTAIDARRRSAPSATV
jgi:hypothetical protein